MLGAVLYKLYQIKEWEKFIIKTKKKEWEKLEQLFTGLALILS